MTRTWHLATSVLATVAALSILSACQGSPHASGDPQKASPAGQTSLDLPQKNIDRWVLPLDSYIFGDQDLQLYAISSSRDACLRAKGYDLPPLYAFNIDGPMPANFNASGLKFMNTQIAEKYGYSSAPDLRRSLSAVNAYFDVLDKMNDTNPTFAKDSDACDKAADTAVGTTGDLQSVGVQLSWAADDPKNLPSLAPYAAKWKQCMGKYGIPDLPDTPSDMPTPSLETSWGPLPSSPEQVSGAKEIADATHDAQCRDSSGYTTALYNALWDAQVRVMEQHASELPAAKAEIDRQRSLAIKVAREYKP